MSTTVRWSAGAALVLLTLIGFVRQSATSREFTSGSHGTIPRGYGAFFDTLEGLELAPQRGDVTALGTERTGWWLSSLGVCRQRDAAPRPWDGTPWVRRGGTAVLFMPERVEHERCSLGAGLPIPLRRRLRKDGGPRLLAGDVLQADRSLAVRDPIAFWEVRAPWRVRATLAGQPFAIERSLEHGRVIVVADGRFLQNAHLGEGDAALAGVDLVRAFGAPVFDETVTARQARGTVSYLRTSPALALFLALGVLGLLVGSHGRALPPRRLDADAIPEPRLGDLVDSLATLYARSGPPAQALQHYRAYARATLRRHFGLPVDAPTGAVAECAARHGAPARVLALLRDDAGTTGAEQAEEAMRALDTYLWKVTS